MRNQTHQRRASTIPRWRRSVSTGRGGVILNRGNQTTVRLDRRAYSPVLRQADLPTVTVPWWGNRQLRYEYA